MIKSRLGRNSSGFRPSAAAGYLCIGCAALFWAISASMGRAVFLGRFRLMGQVVPVVPPLMLAQSRTTLAACVLIPALCFVRGFQGIRIKSRDLRDCVIVGILGIAGSNYFYYLSIQRTTVATAIILQYLAPVFVLLWMLCRRLQPPTVSRVGGVLVAVLGSALAIGVASPSHSFPWLTVVPGEIRFDLIGVIAALIAALSFAFYNVFGRHLVERIDRWTVVAWAFAGAAIGWMFVNPPWRVIAAHYSFVQWTFMILFSVTSILVPFSLYFAGLRHLDATRAIVTSCLEPVFTILVAAIALGEWVGRIQVAGILFVLASTVLIQLESQQSGSLSHSKAK